MKASMSFRRDRPAALHSAIEQGCATTASSGAGNNGNVHARNEARRSRRNVPVENVRHCTNDESVVIGGYLKAPEMPDDDSFIASLAPAEHRTGHHGDGGVS